MLRRAQQSGSPPRILHFSTHPEHCRRASLRGGVRRFVSNLLEELREFLRGEAGLPENIAQRAERDVFVVNGNRDEQFGPRPMEEAGVTASLVVDVEAGSLEGPDAFPGLMIRSDAPTWTWTRTWTGPIEPRSRRLGPGPGLGPGSGAATSPRSR